MSAFIDMARGYAGFVNGGRIINPTLLDRVQDRHGRTLAANVYRHAAYAVPKDIQDVDATVAGLTQIFPDLDGVSLHRRLSPTPSVPRGLHPWVKAPALACPKRAAAGGWGRPWPARPGWGPRQGYVLMIR